MRILIYGAGVLGGNLAHDFHKAKQDTALLARGQWAKQIKENGLRIKHMMLQTKDEIQVIEQLKEGDVYDVIFVAIPYSQLDSILPILHKNRSKTIVFVGNNMRAEEYEKKLPGKTVLFGFSSACGKREKTRINSISMKRITIGQAKGDSKHLGKIVPLLKQAKYKVTVMPDMDAWLKTHAAFILPMVYACYETNGNLKAVKNNVNYLNKLIDAVKEGYDVIKAAGYEIVPYEEYEYVTTNRRKCFSFLKMLVSTFVGKKAIADHAMTARDEMSLLSNEFELLRTESGIATPALDFIKKS